MIKTASITLSELEQQILKDLAEHQPVPGMYKSKSEPLHLRFGGKTHYGSGKHGKHYGVKLPDGQTAHLYKNRIYVGNSQAGQNIKLTDNEIQRANTLLQMLEKNSTLCKNSFIDIVFPCLEKQSALNKDVKLRPHQETAVQFINENNGRGLLAHGTGTGKTLAAIAAVEDLKAKNKATKALIITPASLKENFLTKGIKKFTDSTVSDSIDGESDYQIVSLETFRKNPNKYIEESGADSLIVDEIHRAKEHTSQSNKALRDGSLAVKNVIGLTGSFISNHPKEVIPLLNIVHPNHTLGTRTGFKRRYTEDKRIPGGKGRFKYRTRIELKNKNELGSKLSPAMHYLGHSDIVNEMPSMKVEDVHVEMSPTQQKLYNFALGDLDRKSRKLIAEGLPPTQSEASFILPRILKARQAANSIATHKIIPLAESAETTPKVRRLLDDVEKHLEKTPDGQAIIYTNLVNGGADVLKAGLETRGHSPGVYAGIGSLDKTVTDESRKKAITDFTSGKNNVIILTPAASEGISLDNATAFFELDRHYNPEKNQQAIARGRRIGGLAHRLPKDRVLEVKRYFSDPIKKMFKNKEIGVDKWIDNIATEKDRINTDVKNTIVKARKKTSSINDWIKSNVKDPNNNCFFYAGTLAALHPNLNLVRGTHTKQHKDDTAHFWLEDKKGKIIDPTEKQYAAGKYNPLGKIDIQKNLDFLIDNPLFKSLKREEQKKIHSKFRKNTLGITIKKENLTDSGGIKQIKQSSEVKDDIPDIMYHASPQKLTELKAPSVERGIFLANTPGLASIFSMNLRNTPEFLERFPSRKGSWGEGFSQWGWPDEYLAEPLKEINIKHNIREFPEASGESEGYIHEVDVSKIKDLLKRYALNDDPREQVYHGESLPISKVYPHKMKWTARYDKKQEKKYGGPAKMKEAALKLRPRVSLYVYNDEGKVLAGKSTHRDTLQFPGGGVDKGNTINQAAKQEGLEEAGVAVGKLQSVNTPKVIAWPEDMKRRALLKGRDFDGNKQYFRAAPFKKTDKELLGIEGDAIKGLKWYDIDKAINILDNHAKKKEDFSNLSGFEAASLRNLKSIIHKRD